MVSLRPSHWLLRVLALETLVVALGGLLLYALVRVVNVRAVALHVASLLTLP